MKISPSFWILASTLTIVAGAALIFSQKPTPITRLPEPPVAAVKSKPVEPMPSELALLLESPAPSMAPLKKGKPLPQDPAARAALSLVGTDTTAELIWQEAINNPELSKQERQDLIEDLNEDGLPKSKDLTRSHLALIQSRLKIIDRLMPEAIDKTNADAFAEARKDLLNMQTKLSP